MFEQRWRGSRVVVREQREETQRRSGMSRQLGKMYEHVLNGAEVFGRNALGGIGGDADEGEAPGFSRSVPAGLAKRLWPASQFWGEVGKTCRLVMMEGAPSPREIYRPGQGKRRNCPVNYSGLPGT